jgi:hypothetical protein
VRANLVISALLLRHSHAEPLRGKGAEVWRALDALTQ